MLVGYARVSTAEQSLDLQLDALRAAGCEQIYRDTASGTTTTRAGLDDALSAMTAGDVLAVWRLDRLGRSLPHLVGIINELAERGIGFRSLTEAMDTTTAGGRLVLHIFAALAQFERDLIVQRTRAGLAAARSRGAPVGRPPALTAEQWDAARTLLAAGEPVAKVARLFAVNRSTLYRWQQRATETD